MRVFLEVIKQLLFNLIPPLFNYIKMQKGWNWSTRCHFGYTYLTMSSSKPKTRLKKKSIFPLECTMSLGCRIFAPCTKKNHLHTLKSHFPISLQAIVSTNPCNQISKWRWHQDGGFENQCKSITLMPCNCSIRPMLLDNCQENSFVIQHWTPLASSQSFHRRCTSLCCKIKLCTKFLGEVT